MGETRQLIKNKGVQIILKRMHSNPEEFTSIAKVGTAGRWGWLMEQVILRVENSHKNTNSYRVQLAFLTNDEIDALYDTFMSIQGDAFTHAIMRELLGDAED